jgi:type I restriction enzyme S subunit
MEKQANIDEFTADTEGTNGTEKVRLKHIARVNPTKSELSHLDPETNVSFVPLEDFGTDGEIKNSETRNLEEVYDGYTYFKEGDIAIAKITPSFENGKGAICRGLKNGIGFGTTELHILRPREGISTEFLWYTLRSKAFMDEATNAMRGVAGQQRVPTEFVENYQVPHPSIDQQKKAVHYIKDHESRISRLSDKKEEIVELLDAKRTAEITRLITEGISEEDKNSKQIESKWYREIPDGWELKRLNYLRDMSTTICYGIVLPGPDQDEGVPIIKGGDCHPEALDPETLSKTTYDKAAEYERSKLEAGDLVYEIRGSVGRVVKVPPELAGANLTQDTARVSPAEDIDSDWLKYALISEPFRQQMDLHTRGATIQGVNLENLRNGEIPVPPYEEQQRIAEVATQIDERLQTLSDKIQREKSLLSERKTATITKAASGQIDLTDWCVSDI